jgi:hypothetical protein
MRTRAGRGHRPITFEVKHGVAALSCTHTLVAAGSVTTIASATLTGRGSASAVGVRTVTGSTGGGST